MKSQLLKEIGHPSAGGKWGYKYKGYYIVPNHGSGYEKVKWYDFYTPDYQSINLHGCTKDYTTLDYAKSFVTWRIEDAIRDYEKQWEQEVA